MKTKQKMLTKPITAGFASIFYFKSVKDGIIYLIVYQNQRLAIFWELI